MDLRDKYAKRDAEQGFEPLELNEWNVQAIFNRCGKDGEDGSTAWDQEALEKNKANISYLLGQLSLVLEGVAEHELDDAFFKRYTGEAWTGSVNQVIDLLNMGGLSAFCSFFKRDDKQYVKLKLFNLKPTLSPQDPKFAAWWEGADGLLIQAEAAAMDGRDADALAFYGKAAEQGDAVAQFTCGFMYSQGKGTEEDEAKALYWYEKAAEQGIAVAQFNCGQMYFFGEGAAVDKRKAKAYFRKVAEQTEDKELQENAERFLRKYF